jgi:hypothetical protein
MQRRISDKLNQFLSHFRKIKVIGGLSCGNHDVASSGEKLFLEPEYFPDEPLKPVPDDRTTHLPADRDPQP